ncbi:MAG TPA: hypothetical protein VNJ02_17785 [Vicinamibacterales bacterium]|nr:hypothetical protein [Vicinamibacterales bacterium]
MASSRALAVDSRDAVADLCRRVELLERRIGGHQQALVGINELGTLTAWGMFTARSLWRRLRLLAERPAGFALVDNPRQLGKLLRRLSQQGAIDGPQLLRVGQSRDGLLWRVSRV